MAIDKYSHMRYNHRHRKQTTSRYGYIQGGTKK
nr:MAG TPA: Sulfakinin family [Bacteriophage sp.]